MHFSILSDLKKTTAVVESLSTIQPDVLFQRLPAYFKTLLIKSEPDKEYPQQIPSDVNLPAVPEENFIQKREVTVDSYSETISS